jgi:uncharacterized protein DUF5666
MEKSFTKRGLLIGGVLTLLLVAFLAGGIDLATAQAASTNASGKGCDTKPKCVNDGHNDAANLIKALVTINAVSGNTFHATYQAPNDKKGSAVTITTTGSTQYEPDQSVVAAGKTVVVVGTVNSDGSITAQSLAFYDPTVASFSGVITRIDGSTITLQNKDTTLTVLVTESTTFLRAVPGDGQSKQFDKVPASQTDLQVGTTINADGKLNSDSSLTATSVIIWPAKSEMK